MERLYGHGIDRARQIATYHLMSTSTNGVIQHFKSTYGKFKIIAEKLEEGSNPIASSFELTLDSVDINRNVLCRRQTQCVTYAAAQKWAGFQCNHCKVSEPLGLQEQRNDLEGLAMLLETLDLFRFSR